MGLVWPKYPLRQLGELGPKRRPLRIKEPDPLIVRFPALVVGEPLDGGRQSLLFRLRRAYQGENNGKRAGVKNADESTAKDYERIACGIGKLPEEDRQKMVEKLRRDRAPAGAVA